MALYPSTKVVQPLIKGSWFIPTSCLTSPFNCVLDVGVWKAEFQYPKMLKKLIEHATKHVTVGDLDQLSSAVSSLHSLRIQTIEAQRSQAAQSAPKNQSRHDDFPDFM